MNTTSIIEGLNAFGDRCLEDSKRWFPELHTRGIAALAAHYTLGLVGEIGEAEEVLYVTRDRSALPGELADCLVYAVDLGRCLRIDVTAAVHAAAADHVLTPILVTIGRMVNAVKKLNRGDMWAGELIDTIAIGVGSIIWRTMEHARAEGINLIEAWEDKHAELERRWG